MKRITTILACTLVVATVCQAADWTEFRGPNGQGHSAATGLPETWSDRENVVWNTPLPGVGWSSPVVVGDRVFLTTAESSRGIRDPNQSLQVICLSAQDGSVVWQKEAFQQKSVNAKVDRVHNKNSQASPSPITDGKNLFVHFGTRGTACMTLDGEIVWKNQKLKYEPVHGNGGSPILVDDMLVLACDGGNIEFIVALDTATGKIRWKTDRTADHLSRKFAFGTPLLIEVNGKRQIVSQGAGAVYGYRPEDGGMIWKVDYKDGYSVIPRPVFSRGLVFVSSGYNKAVLFAIDPDGEGDITDTHVRWTLDRGAPHTPSPLAVGDEIYVVSDGGILTCADAVSGKVHYQERLGGKFSASPLFADGRIYLQSEDGEAIVFSPGTEFAELARNRLEPSDVRTFASYAVYQSSLLIRSEKQVFRVEAGS